MVANINIDLTGLRCPLPVLRVKKALSEMTSGDVLQVFATDSGANEDIPSFLKQAGHDLQAMTADNDGYHFTIIKK